MDAAVFVEHRFGIRAQRQDFDVFFARKSHGGIEQAAADAELPMLDLVFFTPEQIETMHEGEVNEAQERVVEIWNTMKAAAGA